MASFPTAATTSTTGIGAYAPAPERLSLQREANDLVEALGRAHALLDQMAGPAAPVANQQSVALMPLGAAIAACRGEIDRLNTRLDVLLSTIGQL